MAGRLLTENCDCGIACGGVVLTTSYMLISMCRDCFVPRKDGLAGAPTIWIRHYDFFRGAPCWVLVMWEEAFDLQAGYSVRFIF